MKITLTKKMLAQINSDFEQFEHRGAVTLATNNQGVWIVNEPNTQCSFLGKEACTEARSEKPTHSVPKSASLH